MIGKRKKGRPIGETIGGIIVGFDQQIFRTTPPVQELVAKARPVRTTTGQDGSTMEVVFPDEARQPPAREPPATGTPSSPDEEPGP